MATAEHKVIIMGAAGRDFHDFNVYWKHQPNVRVIAFTAAQIPDIEGRVYPPQLSGPQYPDGIPIKAEEELTALIGEHHVDTVAMAYSDLPQAYVMDKAATVNAAGANFVMLGAKPTMLKSSRPVIAVCAVRTGCGKSQTSRRVTRIIKEMGKKVAAIRHPMPYGDLTRQICQRFATLDDLVRHECTVEEREEFEPHIRMGNVVFAGVDYEQILRQAEKDAEVILWDGGNNDTAFIKPDLYIVVADPHRPGHELTYYPGATNTRLADIVVINKVDTAEAAAVERVEHNIRSVNPRCTIIRADSPITVSDPDAVKDKRVLVVEDGPTVTHGDMRFGAGHVAARKYGAAEIVDPRPHAAGSIRDVFAKYNHLTDILPAMGYGAPQLAELADTIKAAPCDLVLVGTPIDLAAITDFGKPSVRVLYELEEKDPGVLREAIARTIGA